MIIRPEYIRKKVALWYHAFLRSEISDEVFFPKPVPFGRVKPIWVNKQFEELHHRLIRLRQHSKAERGHGYTVVWEEVNNRTIGKNLFPTGIYVADKSDYLSLLSPELEEHYRAFSEAWPRILAQFPRLSAWTQQHVKKVGDYGAAWSDLLKVCQWFVHHYEPDRHYIRELPVAVPTKFVEQHKSILSELLTQLLPAECIRSEFVGNRDHNFERRFGLKYDETLIRVRWLDASRAEPIDDMAIRHSAFAHHPLDGETIIITENKMNFLTLPPLPRTLALWGGGFPGEFAPGSPMAKHSQNTLLGRPGYPRSVYAISATGNV